MQPWHFEQHHGEGVFIPAGCPHQVHSFALRCESKQAKLSHSDLNDDAQYEGRQLSFLMAVIIKHCLTSSRTFVPPTDIPLTPKSDI